MERPPGELDRRYGRGPWRFMCWGDGETVCPWRSNDAGAADAHFHETGHVVQDVDPGWNARQQLAPLRESLAKRG
jgi:hypothetical protein